MTTTSIVYERISLSGLTIIMRAHLGGCNQSVRMISTSGHRESLECILLCLYRYCPAATLVLDPARTLGFFDNTQHAKLVLDVPHFCRRHESPTARELLGYFSHL